MSRFNRLWVLLAPTVLVIAGLGVTSPAFATDPPPTPPASYDVCGTKQDQFYVPADDFNDYYVNGVIKGQDTWYSTGDATSVTVVARHYTGTEVPFTLMFGAEPNSSCVEAADTVTTEIIACNTSNNGTLVKFTYTNTDDSTDWWRTNPVVTVDRWDQGQLATVSMPGRVLDGEQASATVGDMSDRYHQVFLSPGTYSLKVTTDESGGLLSNRLFVPACGTYKPPAGDPMGGPIPPPPPPPNRPKASIGRCYHHAVRVNMDARLATKTTKYHVVIDPRRGKTRNLIYYVAAKKYKSIVYRYQKNGTWIKVYFAGKVVTRKLSRC